MIIFIVVIIAIVLVIGVYFYNVLGKKKSNKVKIKKEKKPKKEKKQKQQATVKNVNLSVVESYMMRKELIFWKYLNSILPREHIAVPKVNLSDLFIPDGDRNVFNLVSDKTLDFVIFSESSMHIELVIDLYDKSFDKNKLSEQDPLLDDILNKLNIKVLDVLLSTNFDREATKKDIFKALNIPLDDNKE